ncbi:hypothetical protein KUL118_37760 [Tenacibaculum sp. KUL118]|nr:hypothetical protein KUL118_37760 [Tenacibaculum sp. KUL118]
MLLMDHNIKSGIVGGTLLSAFLNMSWDDILFTIVMASIGAVVSFIVSLLLRWLVKQLKL